MLRFTYAKIDSLTWALSTNFASYGAPGDLVLEAPPSGTYYACSLSTGFGTNLAVSVGEQDPNVVLNNAYSRIAHLKAKMLAELKDGTKIFVRKMLPDETEEQFHRMVREIRRHGPSTVLLVRVAADGRDPEWMPRPPRWIAPGVMEGEVRAFSPSDKAWDLDFEPWIWLCDQAYALHHDVPVETLYPVPADRSGRFSPKLRLHRYVEHHEGVCSAMRAVPPTAFDPGKVYLFQTWVWVPAGFTGDRVFALVGQEHMQFEDADLGKRECWQRVWRAGRFRHDVAGAAPVGLAMAANPGDRIWSWGAEMYEGVFSKFVPKPTFRPSHLRLMARR